MKVNVKIKNKFEELSPSDICPCGSGKPYGECCKLKNFRFGWKSNRFVRSVPLNDKALAVLEAERTRFCEYYGRLPKGNDYVLSFAPVYNHEALVQLVDAMRTSGLPENIIYACYKSGGILPHSSNLNILPDADIAEFQKFCDEYTEKVSAPIQNPVNALKFVMLSNEYIRDQLAYIKDALVSTCYDLIRRHTDPDQPLSLNAKDCLSFIVFSALKTTKTLQSIQLLEERRLSECIYALGRSLFENYMYLCAINHDSDFFQLKLSPMIDSDNYDLIIEPNGRVSRKKAVEKATGKAVNVKVNISDLKRYFTSAVDAELYSSFYQEACQYVHVDILSADHYFGIVDIYDQIDPALIAGVATSTITLMLLQQISESAALQQQYKADLRFLLNSLGHRLAICLSTANSDQENVIPLVPVLLKRLAEYGYTPNTNSDAHSAAHI